MHLTEQALQVTVPERDRPASGGEAMRRLTVSHQQMQTALCRMSDIGDVSEGVAGSMLTLALEALGASAEVCG